MPRVSCATCTTCIHIHVPQCHTMSYNVIQCHTMSYNVIQCHTMSYNVIQCHTMSYNVIQCLESFTCPSQPRRICRDGPVDSFQQSWSLYFRRRPQTAREGEIHSTLVTPGHQCAQLNISSSVWIAPFKNDSKVQNPFCLPSVIFGFTQFSSSFCLLPFVTCRLATGCTLARLCGLRLSEKEQQQSAWIILDPQLLLASSKIMSNYVTM